MTPSQVASLPPQPVKALSDTDAAPESAQEMQQPVQAQETNQGAADTLETMDLQSSLPLDQDPVPELTQQGQLASDPQDQSQGQEGLVQDQQAIDQEISDTLDNTGVASSDSKEPGSDPSAHHHHHQQLEEGEEDPAQRETDDSTLEQSTPSAPVPKQSAWSTLLPGVAPIPAPKPPAPMAAPRSTATKSAENIRQLHELYPIVLPHESEVKLSMEMIDLFENLLPTEESHERRTLLIKKIEHILQVEWPGQDIKAHPFGSTVNDLGTSSSDVDICITTDWVGLKNVQMLANAFRKHGMQKVFCVPRAKVPIVKLWDPELHLSCDMNINTPLGLMNTKMIKTYVAIDPRVRPFAMIIKHWARRRVLNDAANGGTISTYTWICIVINFLQMRSPPILPSLHKFPHTLSKDNQVINGNNTSFCDDLEQLEGFGLANKETLGGLLYAFFRRFAVEFDYDHHVISVREGCYLTKESKGWHLPGKQYKLFCVEEPFDTTRNLGNSSDMASSKGLKEEFRRALDILHQKVSLNLMCAQWVFPPSYYHTNNNTRKNSNGTVAVNNNSNNYAAGRRYANGYRSHNYAYDDRDYDDDDDEEEEEAVPEVSVMETLNIGTRPSTSKDPNGSRGGNSSRQNGGESSSSKNSQSKDSGSNANRNQSRAKQSKGDKENAGGDGSRSGSNRNQSKQDSGSASSSKGRQKSSGRGDGQKNNRGGSGSNSGRAPRAAVEFSLADIANVVPKLMSAAAKSDQDQTQKGNGSNSQTGSGEDGSGSKNKRKGGKKNVYVLSTNSNRGDSSRRQPAAKVEVAEDQEKANKVIFVEASEEDQSGTSTPPV
ncbi:poly(A) RNA polymerase GLD2 [Entomortierella parvispora]|uniref:polynucleotide adenylyltransferase n=1 Tax=Entomortierella parvispora TaxID=205924 RepID=A0A9P3HCH2_9FUNG|nr:poly(A) RNA polymerase GLD2 [Entomortierella parvispora]